MAVTEAVRPRLASRLRTGSALLGPAFVAAIAYVDPGNVAANISAGARYGYLLVWVIVAANLMAALVQYLSAKLGLVSGMSLPEALRARLSRPARLAYWLQAEVVAVATDLAEVVGGAIALYLLFDLPLVAGGLVTGAVSLTLLAVQDRGGQRTFERVVTGLLLVIASASWPACSSSRRRRRARSAAWCRSSRDRAASSSPLRCWARRSCRTPSTCTPAWSATGTAPRTSPAAAACCAPPAPTSDWRCCWPAR